MIAQGGGAIVNFALPSAATISGAFVDVGAVRGAMAVLPPVPASGQ
jgi:hypothetical protein